MYSTTGAPHFGNLFLSTTRIAQLDNVVVVNSLNEFNGHNAYGSCHQCRHAQHGGMKDPEPLEHSSNYSSCFSDEMTRTGEPAVVNVVCFCQNHRKHVQIVKILT